MSSDDTERLHDDKVRRDFLDEMIVAGVIAVPFSYDELKEVTDRLEARIRWTERRDTVEQIRPLIHNATHDWLEIDYILDKVKAT